MGAVVIAALGFAGAAVSLAVNGYLERRRVFAEQLAIAFDRFKQSQRRSAGVASLAGLRASSPRFWRDHDKAVTDFLYAQSVYLLCEGSNRFKAHEIANLRQMLDWIVPSDAGTDKLAEWQRQGLNDATNSYLDQARDEGKIKSEADANAEADAKPSTDWAVEALASELRTVQRRIADRRPT